MINSMKKLNNRGSISVSLLLITTLIILMLFTTVIEVKNLKNIKNYLNDGLVLSNMASSVFEDIISYENFDIDVLYDQETETWTYVIPEMVHASLYVVKPEESYQKYLEVMQLNVATYINSSSACYNLHLAEYRVYNYHEDYIKEYIFNENGFVTEITHDKSVTLYAPNGVEITATAIYSRIRFDINGILVDRKGVELDNCIVFSVLQLEDYK